LATGVLKPFPTTFEPERGGVARRPVGVGDEATTSPESIKRRGDFVEDNQTARPGTLKQVHSVSQHQPGCLANQSFGVCSDVSAF